MHNDKILCFGNVKVCVNNDVKYYGNIDCRLWSSHKYADAVVLILADFVIFYKCSTEFDDISYSCLMILLALFSVLCSCQWQVTACPRLLVCV